MYKIIDQSELVSSPMKPTKLALIICRVLWLVLLAGITPVKAQIESPDKSPKISENMAASFGNADSLLRGLKLAYNQAVQQNDPLESAGYLKKMGKLLFETGHYPQALDNLLRADEIYRKKGNTDLLATNLNLMGQVYYRSRQSSLARKMFDEALTKFTQVQNLTGVAEIYGRLGHLYEKEQAYDSAFIFQHKALASYQKVGQYEGVAKIYENLGSIFEDLETYDSAFYYFNKAYHLNEKKGHMKAQIEVLNNLGDILRKTGKYRQSLEFSRKALKLAIDKKEHYQISGAYNDLGKAYNLLNQNDSAYYYVALSRSYENQIYSEESNMQIAMLKTLYDIGQKDVMIEKLTQQQTVQNLIMMTVGVVILLLLIVAGLVISRQRLKIKNEQILHEQKNSVLQAKNELIEAELKNKTLEESNLKQQLETKSVELSSYTLHVIRKNQILADILSKLNELVKEDRRDQKKQMKALAGQISDSLQDERHWEEFRSIFEQVHQSFFDKLKEQSDSLTSNDLRLIALIKMNMTSGDMAILLGISQDSLRVVRHPLRKKLNLQQGENLSNFIQSI
ncbi:tetratricopeptide repeat protein [Dyadobacter jejuensis]|uniref:tetratricopeptide repeat protein n=1 Tax=Dyadobacter jejuensis TaxID=1082580 RepID=UPI001E2C7B07|nr:tetratricopeptide repeat protein [Dyadobacter jejuensis]